MLHVCGRGLHHSISEIGGELGADGAHSVGDQALSSADLEPERKVTPRAATGRPSRVITGLAMQLIRMSSHSLRPHIRSHVLRRAVLAVRRASTDPFRSASARCTPLVERADLFRIQTAQNRPPDCGEMRRKAGPDLGHQPNAGLQRFTFVEVDDVRT